MKTLIFLLLLATSAFGQASVLTIQEADGVPKKAGITKIIVTNGTLTISGTTATIETGGGGEGAPGGDPGTIQYNDTGVFGGVSGVTTNGTTMTFASGALIASNIVNGAATLTLPSTTDTIVGRATTDTLTNKTLTTPTIGSFANATHSHANAAGGGTLNASVIAAGELALARGGTGASLADPGGDRIVFWDDSAGVITFLQIGTNLTITDTTLDATGGGGDLDVGTSPILNGTAGRLFYETAGNVLGEISGATSNGTALTVSADNLITTSPHVITSIDDTNGNPVVSITPVGSSVNNIGVANAATGQAPVISTTGETNVNLTMDLNGTGYLRYLGPHMLLNGGASGVSNLFYVGSDSSGAVDASMGFFVAGVGSGSATDGPYFLARGNNFAATDSQRGAMFFSAGNSTGTATRGTINFLTGNDTPRALFPNNGGFRLNAIAHAALPASDNGTIIWCNDCEPTTPGTDNTCASGGDGAMAFRVNGAWLCFGAITQ